MTSDLAIAHWLLGLTVFAYVGGALAALSVRGAAGRALTAIGAVAGSLATLALGLWSLGAGVTPTLALPVLPFSGLALRVDGLSAFFLVVVGVAGVAVGAYGFGYSAHYEGRYSLRLLGVTLNLLLLSLAIQVTADNALTFLMTWEMMSVAAYVLVLTEHDQGGTVRAANWYLGVTHAGFAALVAAFLLLSAGDPTTSFEAMRAASLSPGARDAVFALALLGFSAKAGIVPLHVWLPMAHPVAPSHVSALMSGVVIKMGVYGLLRVTLDLLGGGPAWWGGVVLGAGFVAALYHTLNHACFKGLLFLGAGSVLQATHTRNMEELGGLIKRMPRTALFFLVGSAAISALPPLNGFASEWLVFQALLGGAAIPRPEVALVMPIAVAMLALTSGLAVACFVKAFGITFLALPRSTAAENAREAPPSMQVGMLMLAILCIALGLGASLVVPALGGALAGLGGLPAVPIGFSLEMPLRVSGTVGEMSPVLVAAGLLLLGGITWIALRLLADRRLRVGETWGCGRFGQTPRMEYTATAFAEPLRRVFAEVYRPTQDLSIDFHPTSKYFVQSIEYRSEIDPWFERLLYAPMLGLMRAVATRVRRLQAGSLHLYLAYMTLALLVLLVAARWPR